jgi:hypothetical protein
MADEKTVKPTGTTKPEPGVGAEHGEMKKVDTKVQEEAAKEREESGGYD